MADNAEKAGVNCGDVAWLNSGGYHICDRSQGHDGDHFDREKARAWTPSTPSGTPDGGAS